MAYDTAFFENPHTGERRKAPVGFSWTMLFFSWVPPIVRGDWRWFILIFLLDCITVGLAHIVGAFIWNRSYMNRLVEKGFRLRATASGNDLRLDDYAGYSIPRLTEDPSQGS